MAETTKTVRLASLLPDSIASDQTIIDTNTVLQPQIDDVTDAIASIEILPRIDELPESILRMLAWENGVYSTEWQLAKTVEAKRQLVKDSFQLNKRRGTRWAVERVFEVLEIPAMLEEWFEYGGDPYTFRINVLDVGEGGITGEQIKLIKRLVNEYKPLRSHNESINVALSALRGTSAYIGCALIMKGEMLLYPQPLAENIVLTAQMPAGVHGQASVNFTSGE